MKPFRDPDDSIGTLDSATAATLVACSSDVALVMDRDGIIQDMTIQPSDLSLELEGYGRWLGRPWSETVSPESQPKVETLLQEAGSRPASAWRQLMHQTVVGRDVPILYSAMKLGNQRFVALGRDLRAVAALQQRLVDAQMSMERDYAKLRVAETRYRLLFQSAAEPVVIVDAGSHKVVEANPAAGALFERGGRRVVGRAFAELFGAESRPRVQALLGDLRGAGRPAESLEASLGDDGSAVSLSASLFRQEGSALVLARLSPVLARATRTQDGTDRQMLEFLRGAPDAIVLADAVGRILATNAAFVAMVQAQDAAEVRGEALEQWFGRPGVDLDVVLSNLRQHGSVRLFATTMRGAGGATVDVEASAIALGRGRSATFGFSIRDVSRRFQATPHANELPRSAEQLTDMIGRVPLKELVRETTDVIEKLCIEAALELTGDNRASAAEVLGLSRQSLYVKLRRYGLAEAGAEEEGA